jgi:hypothetical protein
MTAPVVSRGSRFSPRSALLAATFWGQKDEVEQSEHRPAEADTTFPANSPRPFVPARGALPPRNSICLLRLLHWPPCATGIVCRLSTSGAG